MTVSIYDRLFSYHGENIYPFHMPGHKRNGDFLCAGLLNCDITEIPGADNLHRPEKDGIIALAQARAARIFGAGQSFFLVNGATGGIAAAILSALSDGEKALVARNCHRSVYAGLALAGAYPVYLNPAMTAYGFPGGILPENVEAALEKDDGIAAVILTSPTYEGIVSDIAAISEIVHKKNKRLIVDEAHGAHFAFSPYFPKSAVENGADIVIQSLHKTLPALTQTAVLHVGGERVDIERLKAALAMVQTSSPSYMMLAQADHFLLKLSEDPAIFASYIGLLSAFRAAAGEIGGAVRLLGREMSGMNGVYDVDRGKLCFFIQSNDADGKEIERRLRGGARVQIEMSGARHFLAMTSPADTKEGFDRLYKGIKTLSARFSVAAESAAVPEAAEIPRMIYPPRQAAFGRLKRAAVPLSDSIGHCAADFVIPYPPGIPLIAPGEEITESAVMRINQCVENKVPLLGQESLEKGLINILL